MFHSKWILLIACLSLFWAQPTTSFAKDKEVSTIQEGLSIQITGFSPGKKVVCQRIQDVQRGNYFSVLKIRSGEKERDYAFTEDNEERVLRKINRQFELTDEGVAGPSSPKDGSTLTGLAKKNALHIQVQSGKNLGILTEIPFPKDMPPVESVVLKATHWDTKGKTVVLVVHWEFKDNAALPTDSAYILRYRPWKVRWL